MPVLNLGAPVNRMVLLTVRVGLRMSVNLIKKLLHKVCLLGESRSHQVDRRD